MSGSKFWITLILAVTFCVTGSLTLYTKSAFKPINIEYYNTEIKNNHGIKRVYGPVHDVDFGLFGASQVIVCLQNESKIVWGRIELRLNEFYDEPIATIDLSCSTSRIHGITSESAFNVTEMVNVPGGRHNLYVRLTGRLKTADVSPIIFLPKKLDSSKWYRITSVENQLSLTVRSGNMGEPVLFTNTCDKRQRFIFDENEQGEYKISSRISGNANSMEKDLVLEVADPTKMIGSSIKGVKYPGSDDNIWYLEAGEQSGSVKIKSKLTSTCMSAINGFGGIVVMVDCNYGNSKDWLIRYCDG